MRSEAHHVLKRNAERWCHRVDADGMIRPRRCWHIVHVEGMVRRIVVRRDHTSRRVDNEIELERCLWRRRFRRSWCGSTSSKHVQHCLNRTWISHFIRWATGAMHDDPPSLRHTELENVGSRSRRRRYIVMHEGLFQAKELQDLALVRRRSTRCGHTERHKNHHRQSVLPKGHRARPRRTRIRSACEYERSGIVHRAALAHRHQFLTLPPARADPRACDLDQCQAM